MVCRLIHLGQTQLLFHDSHRQAESSRPSVVFSKGLAITKVDEPQLQCFPAYRSPIMNWIPARVRTAKPVHDGQDRSHDACYCLDVQPVRRRGGSRYAETVVKVGLSTRLIAVFKIANTYLDDVVRLVGSSKRQVLNPD